MYSSKWSGKNLLIAKGIAFYKNTDGYYVSDVENLGLMNDPAREAHAQVIITEEVAIGNECAAAKLDEQLTGAVFVMKRADGRIAIKSSSAVFEKYQIPEKISQAENECDRQPGFGAGMHPSSY